MATTGTKAKKSGAAARKPARRRSRQFIVDEQGRRTAVLLPIEEYEELVEALEQRDDIRALREADSDGGEPVPWERVKTELRTAGKFP
jgi:PHD/YefM family antitoxin component YafN of YafNO toxin-antitoxin module